MTTSLGIRVTEKSLVPADWIYMGRYDLQVEETEKLGVLEEMYRLAHYWSFEDSDLFKRLTRELIESIDTRTYEDCEASQ